MSSTNRGSDRHASDTYFTPRWCIKRLLDALYIPTYAGHVTDRPIRILDPSAGRGRFTEVFQDYTEPFDRLTKSQSFVWHAVEIRPEEEAVLEARVCPPGGHLGTVHMGDFLDHAKYLADCVDHFDLAITNPPFPLAMEMLHACLPLARRVTFLQRLNWLGSEDRSDFFRTHMPDVAELPNRPCFTLNEHGKSATDSIEYAFFTFHGAEWKGAEIPCRTHGDLTILGSTSKEERRVEIDELIAEARRLPSKTTRTPSVDPDTKVPLDPDPYKGQP